MSTMRKANSRTKPDYRKKRRTIFAYFRFDFLQISLTEISSGCMQGYAILLCYKCFALNLEHTCIHTSYPESDGTFLRTFLICRFALTTI